MGICVYLCCYNAVGALLKMILGLKGYLYLLILENLLCIRILLNINNNVFIKHEMLSVYINV